MNIQKLYQDYGIPIAPPGHKHGGDSRWVNTSCPYCSGNPGYHLGFCIDPTSKYRNRFVCFRCGGKKTWETLALLLRVEVEQARAIGWQYGSSYTAPRRTEVKPQDRPLRSISLPPNCHSIDKIVGASRYLSGRGFSSKQLEQEWGVVATGPGARVASPSGKVLDMSYRIIIPVYRKGRLVTYQGRDWTGKSDRKYLACLPELESFPIKSTLYGLDKAEGLTRVELVEGVTDAWRIGTGALACFGIKYRPEQVRELLQFERVGLMFDPDPQARLQARKIIRTLQEFGIETRRIKLPGGKDPAELTEEEKEEVLVW